MVQSDVVELCVLDDGGRAGVVGRVHESEDLGGCWYPPFRLVQRRQRLVSRRELPDRDQLQEVPEIFSLYFQAQCLIHIGGDAVKVAYIPYQLPVASASVPSSAFVMAKA